MIKPVVLCILDGVGVAEPSDTNAVTVAKMPYLNSLYEKYPHIQLDASGVAVGSLPGTIGSSEVGHITIGAGRIVNQYLRRFQLEDFEKNPALNKFLADTQSKTVHFVGLSSDGRVHADIDGALKIAKIIAARGFQIVWHFIGDGRDTSPKTAEKYVELVRETLGDKVVFGSIAGRYYTMDRNENWDRTQKGFDVITGGEPVTTDTIEQTIKSSYAVDKTDEFIEPVRFAAAPKLSPDDGILFFNYRADRSRQFLKLLVKSEYKNLLCFSQYGDGLDEHCPTLLPDVPVGATLGDVLEANKLSQLRLAETEKYNHVTYFFDAERTMDFAGEKKVLLDSPKVATYDLQPEMAAGEITEEFLRNIKDFDVVIMNYANGDMVGHSGNIAATVKAMEFLDICLAKIVPATLALGGVILVTADHGNAEMMADEQGRPWTAHTTSKVPFILVSDPEIPLKSIKDAGLSNIAPTMLKLLGITPPPEMTEPLV